MTTDDEARRPGQGHRRGGDGMTPVGQTADGRWQAGVRRTLPLDPGEAWKAAQQVVELDAAAAEATSQTPGEVARHPYRRDDWTHTPPPSRSASSPP